MINFRKDIDFSKILLIVLLLIVISAVIISLKLLYVRMNDFKPPSMPSHLKQPWSGGNTNPDGTPSDKYIPPPTTNPNNPETPDPPGSEDKDDTYNKVNNKPGISEMIKDMFTNPDFYTFLSFDLFKTTVVKAIVYIVRLGIVNTLRYTAIRAISFLSRVILSLAKTFGLNGLRKLGISLSEKAVAQMAKSASLYIVEEGSEKVAIQAGEKAAEALVKRAALLAADEIAAEVAGPIGVAFDILTGAGMVLDMFDPDGYNKLTDNSAMLEGKNEAYKQLYDALSVIELQLRPVKGPLFKKEMDTKQQIILTQNRVNCIQDAYLSLLLQPSVKEALIIFMSKPENYRSGPTASLDFMSKNMSVDLLFKICNERACLGIDDPTQEPGVVVRESGQCTFKNVTDCLNSNVNYPYDAPAGDVYVEWDYDRQECSMAVPQVLEACIEKISGDNIPVGMHTLSPGETEQVYEDKNSYNQTTGLCEINSAYCDNMGESLDSAVGYINNVAWNNCTLPGGQKCIEAVLGKTITRFFTKVFNPNRTGNKIKN